MLVQELAKVVRRDFRVHRGGDPEQVRRVELPWLTIRVVLCNVHDGARGCPPFRRARLICANASLRDRTCAPSPRSELLPLVRTSAAARLCRSAAALSPHARRSIVAESDSAPAARATTGTAGASAAARACMCARRGARAARAALDRARIRADGARPCAEVAAGTKRERRGRGG